MLRTLNNLSAADTSRVDASVSLRCARYFSLRSRQGGFGVSRVSVQPSTIVATFSPNRTRISSPGRFRCLQSVGATFYYRGHFFAEPDPDIVDPGGATSIFSRIME